MSAPRGQRHCQAACILCADPDFWLYLDRRRRHKHGLTESALPDGTHNEQDARDWLVAACRIQSRADLDQNHTAQQTFRQIRNRFNHWRAKNRKSA